MLSPADSAVNTYVTTPGNKWCPTFLSFSDAESRKLCKKMKVDLSPKDKKIELFHYQDGAFHMEYDRAVTLKSIVAFLKDPKGPPLWEEDPEAKDVVHIDSEKLGPNICGKVVSIKI
ncbi:hypothetical protein U0070_013679 [Myodes glareolus]|uniref:Uncharacterized protein n=1 Tax=Myodes glareolus TaxID=447135 RepID=A0AAW0JND5_MYOGA